MWLSLRDEEAIPPGEGLCMSVPGKVHASFDDKLPLTCMGMFWDDGVLFEFHEHHLFFFSLDQVAFHSAERKNDIRESSYLIREHVIHQQTPSSMNQDSIFYVLGAEDFLYLLGEMHMFFQKS
jgi:hypothetical protein